MQVPVPVPVPASASKCPPMQHMPYRSYPAQPPAQPRPQCASVHGRRLLGRLGGSRIGYAVYSYSILCFIHPSIHSFIHPSIHSFIHPCTLQQYTPVGRRWPSISRTASFRLPPLLPRRRDAKGSHDLPLPSAIQSNKIKQGTSRRRSFVIATRPRALPLPLHVLAHKHPTPLPPSTQRRRPWPIASFPAPT
jgi:hypothetical protein